MLRTYGRLVMLRELTCIRLVLYYVAPFNLALTHGQNWSCVATACAADVLVGTILLSGLQVMLVCQSFGLLLGTVVMVPKTAQTVRLSRQCATARCALVLLLAEAHFWFITRIVLTGEHVFVLVDADSS